MTNTPPRLPLDPAWMKVKKGLELMANLIFFPPVLVPVATMLITMGNNLWEIVGFSMLAVLPVVFLLGLIRCFASPDPLSRGFITGSFLSLLLGVGSAMMRNRFFRPVPPLVDMGVGTFIVLLYQACLTFFLLFLLRIARIFGNRSLGVNCRCYLMVETCVMTVFLGSIFGEKFLPDLAWNAFVIFTLIGFFGSYIWFQYLLMDASKIITQAQSRAANFHP